MTSRIDQLKPDPRNARRHNARNIDLIAGALEDVGAARSIVIDEDNQILAGNATVAAAARAGFERVRVVEAAGDELIAVRRAGLTPAQKTRLALYDNRAAELADWDTDVLRELDVAIDLSDFWTTAERRALFPPLPVAGDPGAQVDHADELREQWQTERGQVWQIGRHRLLCGDATSATDVARLLDGATPLMMVTDPPYGVAYDANWRNEAADNGLIAYAASRVGVVANDDRADWCEAYALFGGDVVYVWHADRRASVVDASLAISGFEVRRQIIWAKPRFVISQGHYHWQHEGCWYAVRRGGQAHWCGDHSQTTLWEITLDQNVDGGHSTQKPVECMARSIRNHEGEVYDPFVGSGTTIVAAEQEGRVCYAMDIDPKYIAVALERLSGMGLEARLVDST